MKNLKSIALAVVMALGTLTVTAQKTTKVNVEKSSIEWIGKKVTGKHNGTVNLSAGALVFDGKKLKGGEFTVDMNSINATDVSGNGREKLNGHLKADDFFGTDKFPTAELKFKTLASKGKNLYTVTADLTIKGITKPVTFDMTVGKNTAITTFNIDRTKYDIKYGSGSFFDGLGDKAILDEFELTVNLVF
jgi:polyisoprenoid-binding protein YceI